MRARGNFDFFLRIYRLAVEIEMMFARGEAEKTSASVFAVISVINAMTNLPAGAR